MQIVKDILKIVSLLAIIAFGCGLWREQRLARQTEEREADFKSSQSCSEVAGKVFQKLVQNPLLVQPSANAAGFARHTDYASHFSRSKNKCYVEITSMTEIPPLPNPEQNPNAK
jgi:hypothetical protein